MVDYGKIADEAYAGVDASYAAGVETFAAAEKAIEDNTMPPELIATHITAVLAATKKKQSGAEVLAIVKQVMPGVIGML